MERKKQQDKSRESSPAAATPRSDKATAVVKDQRPQAVMQQKIQELADNRKARTEAPALQRKAKQTSLPDQLKSGIEGLSGLSMDAVNVYRNSSRPASMQAHAYAQGTDIHLASGQEKHLPHEAWHVVQQMQGRVRPTTQVGGTAVNDDSSLEREADVMGGKAEKSAGGETAQLQKLASTTGTYQLKTNDLPVLDPGRPFDDGRWKTVRDQITEYNIIPAATDKVYAKHNAILQSILSKGNEDYLAVNPGLAQEKASLQEDIRSRTEVATHNQSAINLERSILVAPVEELREFQISYPEKLKAARSFKPNPEDPYSGRAIEDNKREIAFFEREIPLLPARIQDKEAEIDGELRVVDQRLQQAGIELAGIDPNPARLQELGVELAELNTFKTVALDQNTAAEIIAVTDQMTNPATAKDAAFQPIDETGRKMYGGWNRGRPVKLNKLARKFEAASDVNVKFDLLMRMQEQIKTWRQTYVDTGTDNIKAEHAGIGVGDDRRTKLADIKLMEEQIKHTGKVLFGELFKSTVPNVTGLTTVGDKSMLAGATKAIATELTSESNQIKGLSEKAAKSGDTSTFASDGVSGGLTEGNAVADIVAQIMVFRSIAANWTAEKSNGEKFALIMEGLEAGGSTLKDVVSGVNAGLKMGKVEGKGVNNMEILAQVVEPLVEAIAAVKSTALGIISLMKVSSRKGVDDEMAFTHGATGAISLAKAVKSGFSVVKGFFSALSKVPGWLSMTIPIIGIAVNAGNAILNIYQTHKARKREDGMKEMGEGYGIAESGGSLTKLSGKTTIPTNDLIDITQTERRGILWGKKYLRFNAFVLGLIDAYPGNKEPDDRLRVVISATKTIYLTKEQIDFIREYEYISKMAEINQKRKIKGGTSASADLINMGADIATLSGAGAVIGVAIKGGVSGIGLTHTLGKAGQTAWRDSQARKAPGVATDVESYKAKHSQKTDKSRKQKDKEYRRHASYILDRLILIPDPGVNIAAANNEYLATKQLLKATGVDLSEFISQPDVEAQFKLLVAAQKTGR